MFCPVLKMEGRFVLPFSQDPGKWQIMRLKAAFVIWLQILVSSNGQGNDVENLYKPLQPGIVSFEEDEIVKNVVSSSKPWLVQFYASWCGHCRHFQPTFSKFGIQVQGKVVFFWSVLRILIFPSKKTPRPLQGGQIRLESPSSTVLPNATPRRAGITTLNRIQL